MYCGSCGKEIDDGAKFCPYCGTLSENTEAVTKAAGAVNIENTAAANEVTAPKSVNTSFFGILPLTGNKLMAYIACLFLYIGLHIPIISAEGVPCSVYFFIYAMPVNYQSLVKSAVFLIIALYFILQLFNKRKLSVIFCIIDLLFILGLIIVCIAAAAASDGDAEMGLCSGACFFAIGVIIQFWTVLKKHKEILNNSI